MDAQFKGKRVLIGDDAKIALYSGVSVLANAVACTLGPRGRCVLIQREEFGTPPLVTKDGVTVAKAIVLQDPAMRMGADMIKEASSRTADIAGDGTTTATVLAHAMIEKGLAALAKRSNPVFVKTGIDTAVNAIVAQLKKMAREIANDDDLKKVATISANGDSALGEKITDAVRRAGTAGVVTVEESKGSSETTVEFVEGLRVDSGWMNSYFVNDSDKMSCTFENALVLLCETKISSAGEMRPFLEEVQKSGAPVLIIAEDVDGEALQTLIVNNMKRILKICAVRIPGWGPAKRELFDDISALTGAHVVSPSRGLRISDVKKEHFGKAARVTVTKGTTIVVGDGTTAEAVKSRASELSEKAKDPTLTHDERKTILARSGRLSAGASVVRVGGLTEVEVRERRDRVDDAICATRAALEEGFVPGGGTALVSAARAVRHIEESEKNHDIKQGIKIVLDSCEAPLRQIAENAGSKPDVVVHMVTEAGDDFMWDAATEKLISVSETAIIDPCKVSRTALQHAASVAGSFLTLEAVIVDA